MNPNVQLWIDALRSGDYKQIKGKLENGDGDCCLGVACRVAHANGVRVIIDRTPEGTILFDGRTKDLPQVVKDWLGLQTTNGNYDRDGVPHCLAEDNDAGKSFDEIAQTIEESPEGLFVDA